MEIEQLRPRLWRWTALHPDWTPEEGGPEGWAQEVASFALVEDDALVLFDPLVPGADGSGDEERFWRALDDDVRHHGPPQILLTVYWHARSAQRIADRYQGAQILGVEAATEKTRERAPTAATFVAGDALPAGIEARATDDPEEVVFWIPSYRALVAGDVLLGTAEGGVRLAPDAWLREDTSIDRVRAALRPLLELPVEFLLLAHGAPVRMGAHAALAEALRRA